jgi:hypothetical protein
LKVKERQQAAGESTWVAAATLAYQMQAAANAHMRMSPVTMPKTMLFIKQERIVTNAFPASHAYLVSSLSS